MKISRGIVPAGPRSYPVVTIGNFDGHHRGHRALLQLVVETARRHAGTAVAVTFDPHPVKILAPQVNLQFLTTSEEKLRRFQEAGVDEVMFLDFTPEFAALSPEEFVRRILYDALATKELFVGEHFAFGKGRAGRIADLIALGKRYDFAVHPMSPLRIDNEVVSSTKIRHLIQAGDVQKARRFLGRSYTVEGTVLHGAKRGADLGWPTANLRLPPDRVTPPDGVYSAQVLWRDHAYDAVCYIGTRPTFGSGERLLEATVLDQRLELYDEPIAVQLIGRIRGDMTFPSAEELSRRIARDVEEARAQLKQAPTERHETMATLPRM
ncbi:MAG TPA: bifunctional riboflavin kinase/FAD synthetase [Nitrospiraceae bacterium]|jgi:riboflavin kinase/FMN adenylyltransferase|nr:bifunctional riboflavin kinase/FAD synthetase [Nitrospiraceae bacterium]